MAGPTWHEIRHRQVHATNELDILMDRAARHPTHPLNQARESGHPVALMYWDVRDCVQGIQIFGIQNGRRSDADLPVDFEGWLIEHQPRYVSTCRRLFALENTPFEGRQWLPLNQETHTLYREAGEARMRGIPRDVVAVGSRNG